MKIYVLLFLYILTSCQQKNSDLPDNSTVVEDDWLVSKEFVKDGAAFSLVNSPLFKNVSDVTYLNDDSKLLLVKINDEIRGYPYVYTDYSEVVNDSFGSQNIAISFCPQTKSGICFNRKMNNLTLELIASGYLFKDNLVLSEFDRNELWSQMLLKKIKGKQIVEELELVHSIEVEFKLVKTYFPEAKIYYHDKLAKNAFKKFKEANDNKFFGIVEEKDETRVELYSYNSFDVLSIKNSVINGDKVMIIGDLEKYFITSFVKPTGLEFYVLEGSFPTILKDNESNLWDVFGFCVEGSRKGDRMLSPNSYVAELWAWKDFFHNNQIIE